MSIKSYVPNALTLLNLFSGILALVLLINENFKCTFYAVCLGILFDFFDGFAARLLKVQSRLGLELDSLADMVTSGVVPGMVMFYLLLNSLGLTVMSYSNPEIDWVILTVPLIGFAITLASAYRLAKFNIDERQTEAFIGLPTPANCLFIASLPILLFESDIAIIQELLTNPWVLLSLTVLSSYMLNSEIHLFSLKVKSFDFKNNLIQLFYLTTSILLIIAFKLLIVPFLILFYVLLSVFTQNYILNKKY